MDSLQAEQLQVTGSVELKTSTRGRKSKLTEKPEVQAKREEWLKTMQYFNPNQLVFIDETGVNIDMTRLYGRSIGNTRIKDSAKYSETQ